MTSDQQHIISSQHLFRSQLSSKIVIRICQIQKQADFSPLTASQRLGIATYNIQALLQLDLFKDSSRDFYETARIGSKNIQGNLSLISEINSRCKVMNMQELESLLENLNKVVPQSQDEEHQRVAREYASLNESLFQCLESHRY